jgi:5,5'-dehydrodivanillate O-demethylase oxygenase subunit
MLTRHENDRLTRVGPGTPAGELLRRYWQVLCPTRALHGDADRKRVRALGENLVVFRRSDGTYACVQERCPHRSASLFFGFLEPDGIRCCYHGWKFDCATGACVERPFETAPPHAGLGIRTYPVQQLGGLLFVYMGPPDTAPLLPRWDVLARNDRPRKIAVLPPHRCNWLQIQENTADTTHLYWLHGHRMRMLNGGTPDAVSDYFCRPIVGYDWRVCEWGIEKSMQYGGDRPEHATWPPFIFPNILRTPEGPVEAMHFRIPIDDESTRIVWVGLLPPNGGAIVPDDETPYTEDFDPPGLTIENVGIETFYGQDRVVWETQGAIADRSLENLGATDRGIAIFRRMLAEQIDCVERGEAPTVAVVRDPAQNECIRFEASEHWYEMVDTP